MSKSRLQLLLILCALLASACASAPHFPAAPATLGDQSGTPYLVGPGDVLNIVVWRNPEVSQLVPVRPDGRFSAPLVDDIVATGKTPSQLAREIELALGKYIQKPVVSVIVQTFVGPTDSQIRVVGQAAHPQALAYRDHLTLLDVMISVGGLTEFAAGNRALIERRGASSQYYSVHLEDLLRKGDMSANVEMKPGDVLVIPETWF